jgi:diacylglycerol kinase
LPQSSYLSGCGSARAASSVRCWWLLNSAIEATVDRIGLERHQLSGLAKDIGSAAVMLSFFLLGGIWLLVLFGDAS